MTTESELGRHTVDRGAREDNGDTWVFAEADESVDLWWTLDGTTLTFVGIEDKYDVIEAPCTFEDNAFSCTLFENVTEAEFKEKEAEKKEEGGGGKA